MAFRIHDSVLRGEIDNRVKGIVRGRIWIEGRSEPITLELRGNAWPDLAGCLITFANPLPRVRHPNVEALNAAQRGTIGDLTASRKVRVFDVPLKRALETIDRKDKPPEHMANSLYLEWFSDANGRVVVESTDYRVTISPPEWRMTPEENEQRKRDAARSMRQFMQKLTNAVEQLEVAQKDPETCWDEFDFENFLKASDARVDKYMELLDKYGNSAEAGAKIAKEMGWDRDMTEEEAEEERQHIDEINRACEEALNQPEPEPDPHREGIDWIRTDDGDLRHPLQHRCFESALKFLRHSMETGLGEQRDKDLDQFVFEFQTTGVKLAGALNGIARGGDDSNGAFIVAILKRALGHLHKAQAGLESVAPKKLLPDEMISAARKEIFAIREGILSLMDEFRRKG